VANTIPALDREFNAERRRAILLAEIALRQRIATERDKAAGIGPKPTHIIRFVDGVATDREDAVKLT
jgi:hypothetical protein